jgi:hypothetical protein
VKALHEVQQHLRFMGWGFRGEIGWVAALEQEYGADRPHAHGLICGPRVMETITMYRGKRNERTVPLLEPYWRAWLDRNGGGRFEVVRGPVDRLAFYCAKYAARHGEIIVSDNLEKFRRPPASDGTAP